MKKFLPSEVITSGLAIFSMLFGAGNLMYPIVVGVLAGTQNFWGMLGFLLTAVCLPVLGLVGIILFNGDYNAFFNRLGKIPGFLAILFCMLIIGPLIAMPRIITVSHELISPYLGNMSVVYFSIIFLFLTFLGTFRENRIIDLLGYIISPTLLISLFIIFVKGLLFGTNQPIESTHSKISVFLQNLKLGYITFDLLGTIFFASIILSLLKQNIMNKKEQISLNQLALISLKAGIIGTSLLGIVYIGMSLLGVLYGHDLSMMAHINPGRLFSTISMRVLGDNAAIIIAIAVLMACFSTIIALSAVVAEYVQHNLFRNKVTYLQSLIIILVITGIVSNFGLAKIHAVSKPIGDICYPAIVVLTLLNVLYKLFGFRPIKLPVLITLLASFANYFQGKL